MENMPWAELIPMTIIIVLFNLIATYLIYMGLFKLDRLRSTANQSLKKSINPMKGVAQEIVSNENYGCYVIAMAGVMWVMTFCVSISAIIAIVRKLTM
jgi:hypothetical protein